MSGVVPALRIESGPGWLEAFRPGWTEPLDGGWIDHGQTFLSVELQGVPTWWGETRWSGDLVFFTLDSKLNRAWHLTLEEARLLRGALDVVLEGEL